MVEGKNQEARMDPKNLKKTSEKNDIKLLRLMGRAGHT